MIALMTFVLYLFGACLADNENRRHQQQSAEHRSAAFPPNSASHPGSYPDYNTNDWNTNTWNEHAGEPNPWRPYRYLRILGQFEAADAGGYRYAYDTENHIRVAEEGKIPEDDPNEDIGTSVRGYYEYVGDDGLTHRVDYTAGKEGFRPITTTIIGQQIDAKRISNDYPVLDSRFAEDDKAEVNWPQYSLPARKPIQEPPRSSNMNPKPESFRPVPHGKPTSVSSGLPNSSYFFPSRRPSGPSSVIPPNKQFEVPSVRPSPSSFSQSRPPFGSVSLKPLNKGELYRRPNPFITSPSRPPKGPYSGSSVESRFGSPLGTYSGSSQNSKPLSHPIGSSSEISNKPTTNVIGDSEKSINRPSYNQNIPSLSSILRLQNGFIGPDTPGLNRFGSQNENIAEEILSSHRYGQRGGKVGFQPQRLNGYQTQDIASLSPEANEYGPLNYTNPSIESTAFNRFALQNKNIDSTESNGIPSRRPFKGNPSFTGSSSRLPTKSNIESSGPAAGQTTDDVSNPSKMKIHPTTAEAPFDENIKTIISILE